MRGLEERKETRQDDRERKTERKKNEGEKILEKSSGKERKVAQTS